MEWALDKCDDFITLAVIILTPVKNLTGERCEVRADRKSPSISHYQSETRKARGLRV